MSRLILSGCFGSATARTRPNSTSRSITAERAVAVAAIALEDGREDRDPGLGLVEDDLDLEVDQLPEQRVGRDLVRRLGLAAAADPNPRPRPVALPGRIERQVAVEGRQRDPALQRERGPLSDGAAAPFITARNPQTRAK